MVVHRPMCDSLGCREHLIFSSLFLLWCAELPSGWTIKSADDLGWSRAVQKYLLKRILYGLLTLFGVSVIIFVVMRILPGDPLVAMFGMEGFMKLSDADRTRIMEDLGLSGPLPVQYIRWLKDIARGSFGKSFFRGESVAEIILHRGHLSAEIGIF